MKVFVFEEMTGGGMVGEEMDDSFLSQGSAMLKAAVADLLRGDFEVVIMRDADVFLEIDQRVEQRIFDETENIDEVLVEIGQRVDWVLVISPESDGLLGERIQLLENAGIKILNVCAAAERLCGDKYRLSQFLREEQVPSVEHFFLGDDWEIQGQVICKDRWGAGCQGMRVFDDAQALRAKAGRRLGDRWVVGKYWEEAMSMSVCVAVDAKENISTLPAHKQVVIKASSGEIQYFGGSYGQFVEQTIGHRAQQLARQAVQAVAKRGKVFGLLGVDLLMFENDEQDRVVEINPRMTLSFAAMQGAYSGSIWRSILGGQHWGDFDLTGGCYDSNGEIIEERVDG